MHQFTAVLYQGRKRVPITHWIHATLQLYNKQQRTVSLMHIHMLINKLHLVLVTVHLFNTGEGGS